MTTHQQFFQLSNFDAGRDESYQSGHGAPAAWVATSIPVVGIQSLSLAKNNHRGANANTASSNLRTFVPLAFVAETKGLVDYMSKAPGATQRHAKDPALCGAFQQGRCHLGQRCHNIHVEPSYVASARGASNHHHHNNNSDNAGSAHHLTSSVTAIGASVPQSNHGHHHNGNGCCMGHGDAASTEATFQSLIRAVTIVLEDSRGREHSLNPLHVARTDALVSRLEAAVNEGTATLKVHVFQTCKSHFEKRCKHGPQCKNIHLCREMGPTCYSNLNTASSNTTGPKSVAVNAPAAAAVQRPAPYAAATSNAVGATTTTNPAFLPPVYAAAHSTNISAHSVQQPPSGFHYTAHSQHPYHQPDEASLPPLLSGSTSPIPHGPSTSLSKSCVMDGMDAGEIILAPRRPSLLSRRVSPPAQPCSESPAPVIPAPPSALTAPRCSNSPTVLRRFLRRWQHPMKGSCSSSKVGSVTSSVDSDASSRASSLLPRGLLKESSELNVFVTSHVLSPEDGGNTPTPRASHQRAPCKPQTSSTGSARPFHRVSPPPPRASCEDAVVLDDDLFSSVLAL